MMLPVIVIESIVGGLMGFKIYERVKDLYKES
jgi:hypothetical protein